MLINVGDTIKTLFLKGEVTEVIDGAAQGWRSTLYYRVRVKPQFTRARKLGANLQIVRHDEIQESRNG